MNQLVQTVSKPRESITPLRDKKKVVALTR